MTSIRQTINRFRCYTMERQASQGQALVLFALALTVLIGFVALSVDAGFLMAERRQVQAAADAGAMAAAVAMRENKDAQGLAAGRDYAALNAGNGATVSAVATGGPIPGRKYVRVTVTKDVDRFFLGAIYTGPWRVQATALAGVETEPADYALITLNKSSEPGIYMNGNTGIRLTGGRASAMSNTNIRGSSNTSFTAPGTIDANGTIQSGRGWTPVTPNMPQIDDPLASMTPPAKGSLVSNPCTNNCTWSSGWYRNINVTLKGTITLSPGVYYFENSTINYQNTNTRLQGSNVLLYFDSNSSWDPKNGETRLTYRTSAVSGVKPGLVVWYARCNTVDFQGNGELYFEGIVYAPCAHWSMHGNPNGDTVRGQMFLGTLEVKGTSDMSVNYNKYVDTVRPRVYLVE